MKKHILAIAILILIPNVFGLKINEIFYDTPGTDGDEEWIEIFNEANGEIELTNYKIGDEETQGDSEGMYQFPSSSKIKSKGFAIVAQKADIFYSIYGF